MNNAHKFQFSFSEKEKYPKNINRTTLASI